MEALKDVGIVEGKKSARTTLDMVMQERPDILRNTVLGSMQKIDASTRGTINSIIMAVEE